MCIEEHGPARQQRSQECFVQLDWKWQLGASQPGIASVLVDGADTTAIHVAPDREEANRNLPTKDLFYIPSDKTVDGYLWIAVITYDSGESDSFSNRAWSVPEAVESACRRFESRMRARAGGY